MEIHIENKGQILTAGDQKTKYFFYTILHINCIPFPTTYPDQQGRDNYRRQINATGKLKKKKSQYMCPNEKAGLAAFLDKIPEQFL